MQELFVSFLQVSDRTHSMFPGITKCADGSLIIHCQSGSEFEASDTVIFQYFNINF